MRAKKKYQIIATFEVHGDVDIGYIEAPNYADALLSLKRQEKYYLQQAQWMTGIFGNKPKCLKLREVHDEQIF